MTGDDQKVFRDYVKNIEWGGVGVEVRVFEEGGRNKNGHDNLIV